MKANSEFYARAEELAKLESEMYTKSDKAFDLFEPNWEKEQKYSLITIAVCAVLALVAVIVLIVPHNMLVETICSLLIVAAVTKAYLEFYGYSYRARILKISDDLFADVEKLSEKRKGLINVLNLMRKDNKELDGSYWWDLGVEPSYKVRLNLPGNVDSYDDPTLILANHLTFSELPKGVYLENFLEYKVFVTKKSVEEMVRSDDMAVVYINDSIMSQPHKNFSLMPLYSLSVDPLEEIESTTISIKIDKDEEMRAYREKLDTFERICNFRDGLVTEKEAQLYGQRTAEDVLEHEIFRDTMERWHRDELDAQPDTQTSTYYKQEFGKILEYRLVTCAYVFVSENDKSNGEVAMILLPKKDLPVMSFTFRPDNKDNPFYGYLEKYLGNDALTIGSSSIRPSIKMLADFLSNDGKELIASNPIDILATKPEKLEACEWCYLIWKTV